MLNPTGTGQAVAMRDTSEIGQFQRQLESRVSDLRMALPSGISPEKFQRTVLTAVAQNPDLLKADRGSLILSCYKAAQDGLLPDGREAALVTFNLRQKVGGDWKTVKLVQYMPMVYGLRKKILQAKDAVGQPVVSALQVGVVYKIEAENGYFRWERGTDPEVQHQPMLDISEEQAADANIVAAYSIATMADGTRSCEVMRRFEIDKVRQTSQTGATGRTVQFGADKGKPIEPKGPWVDWFPEMAKKTVMRRHAKTLPMSGDVIADLGGDDDDEIASRSAAVLLGGTAPDEPTLIKDEPSVADRETGEVLDHDAAEERVALIEAEFGKAKSDKAKRETHERHADFISDLEEPFPELHKRAMAAIPEYKEAAKGKPEREKAGQPADAEDGAGDPPKDEQTDVTKDPFEAKADEYLDRFETAENIVDLKAAHDEFQAECEGWPYEIVTAIEGGFKRHQRRLSPAPAVAEAELAK